MINRYIAKWCFTPLLFSTTFLLTSCASLQKNAALDSEFSLPRDEIMVTMPDFADREDSQIMIARLTQLLGESGTTHEQRAQILYQLGLLYDRLGLDVTARTMFMNALIEVPDFAEAYNFLGIYLSTSERFAEAYDAWDAVLEISPKDEYALFNRGIALYYGNRASLGLQDLKAFYERKHDDPFRIAWLYLLESELQGEEEAQKLLAERRAQMSTQDIAWGLEILDLMQGKMANDEVIKRIREGELSHGEEGRRLCEAYFYMGKLAQKHGHNKQAYDYFHLCVTTGVSGYLEYRYAILEITLMERADAERKLHELVSSRSI